MSELYDSINFAINCIRAVEKKQEYIRNSLDLKSMITEIKSNLIRLSSDYNLEGKREQCDIVINNGNILLEKSTTQLITNFQAANSLDTTIPVITRNAAISGVTASILDKEVQVVWK